MLQSFKRCRMNKLQRRHWAYFFLILVNKWREYVLGLWIVIERMPDLCRRWWCSLVVYQKTCLLAGMSYISTDTLHLIPSHQVHSLTFPSFPLHTLSCQEQGSSLLSTFSNVSPVLSPMISSSVNPWIKQRPSHCTVYLSLYPKWPFRFIFFQFLRGSDELLNRKH